MEETPALNPDSAGTSPDSAAEKPAKRPRNGYKALEIAEQVYFARELLTQGYRPYQIRKALRDKWGVHDDTAERRISTARSSMVADLEKIDRKEKVAQLMEAAEDILTMARDTRQLSNALGALSFQARILGLEQRQN